MKRPSSVPHRLFCLFASLTLTNCQVSDKWAIALPGGAELPLPALASSSRSNSQATAVSATQQSRPASNGYYQYLSNNSVPSFQSSPPIHTVVAAPTAQPLAQQAAATSYPVLMKPNVHREITTAPVQSNSAPRGKVRLVNGVAIAPPDAPPAVRRAVEAGNRMQKFPYKWGGGHAVLDDTGYDCSGTVSYVLRESGLMSGQRPSRGFFTYGEAGEGDWITVWTKDGHVFMLIGGLRLDTGGSTVRTGPRWKTGSRSYKGFVARHPPGL